MPTNSEDFPIAIRKGVKTCIQRPRHPLSHFMSYDKLSSNHRSFLTHLNTITIPKTANEALNSKKLRKAMKVEIHKRKLVGCKWVFTIKYMVDGTLEKV